MAIPALIAKFFQPAAQDSSEESAEAAPADAGTETTAAAEGEVSAEVSVDGSGADSSAKASGEVKKDDKKTDEKPKSPLAQDGYARTWGSLGRLTGLLTGHFLTGNHGVNSRHNGGLGGVRFGLQFTREKDQRHVLGVNVEFSGGRVRRDLAPAGYSHANQFIPAISGSYYFRAHDAVALGLGLAVGVNVLRAKCQREDQEFERPVVGQDADGNPTVTYEPEVIENACDQISGYAGNGNRAADLKATGFLLEPRAYLKLFNVLQLEFGLPLTLGAENTIQDNAGPDLVVPVSSGGGSKALRQGRVGLALDLAPLIYNAVHKNDEPKTNNNGGSTTPPTVTTDDSATSEEVVTPENPTPEVEPEPQTLQEAFAVSMGNFEAASAGIKEGYEELIETRSFFNAAKRKEGATSQEVKGTAQRTVSESIALLNTYESACDELENAEKLANTNENKEEKAEMLKQVKKAKAELAESNKEKTLFETAQAIYEVKTGVEKDYAAYQKEHKGAKNLETEPMAQPKPIVDSPKKTNKGKKKGTGKKNKSQGKGKAKGDKAKDKSKTKETSKPAAPEPPKDKNKSKDDSDDDIF